jgi:hypothetical protein
MKKKKLTAVLISLFLIVNIAYSQVNTEILQQLDEYFNNRKEVYFDFQVDHFNQIEILSKIISIDNIIDQNRITAYANREEFKKFLSFGLDYNMLKHPSFLIEDPVMLDKVNIRAIEDWDFYPTYEAYVDMMYQFASDYPDLCQVFSIGNTYEEHELLMAKISDNVGISENEPQFLYTSTMHGNETAGYVLMLRLIDYLLDNYDNNPRIANMVNEIEIWINPLANPDGTYASGNNTVYGATRYNAHGVDLNRNYPDPEDGPHPDGNEWQIETLAFMDLAENNNFVMSCNIHSGAEVANYPWDTWPQLAADNDWWVYVCREYADTAQANSPPGYFTDLNNGITNGYAWYTIAGGRQDNMTYFHQGREFTLEISNDFIMPPNQLPDYWNYNYRSFLNYMEQVLFGIRGIVTDSNTSEPLNAEIYILDHEEDSSWIYTSLPTGNYNRVIYEGTYDVRYSAPGYISKIIEDVIADNKSTTVLDVELVYQFSNIDEPEPIQIRIFPNPVTSNYFKIKAEDGIKEVRIYNLSGALVYMNQFPGDPRAYIDVSTLSSGSYILHVMTGNKLSTLKIEIIR